MFIIDRLSLDPSDYSELMMMMLNVDEAYYGTSLLEVPFKFRYKDPSLNDIGNMDASNRFNYFTISTNSDTSAIYL